MTERPWTPGPWAGAFPVDYRYVQPGRRDRDEALIRLAPEMAEAILAWDTRKPFLGSGAIVDVATKLRAIGRDEIGHDND